MHRRFTGASSLLGMPPTPPPRGWDPARWDRFLQRYALASQARDSGAGLVGQWRDVSKPRKAKDISPQPPGFEAAFEALLGAWLEYRGLAGVLQRAPTEDTPGWTVYRYLPPGEPLVQPGPQWGIAYHGTWWYSMWSVLATGTLLESGGLESGT